MEVSGWLQAPAALPLGRTPVSINHEPGWAQNRPRHFENEKNPLPLPGFKAQDTQPTLLRPPFLDYKLEFILKARRPTFKYIWSALLEICAMEISLSSALKYSSVARKWWGLLEDGAASSSR
jgi:hypothetical protein